MVCRSESPVMTGNDKMPPVRRRGERNDAGDLAIGCSRPPGDRQKGGDLLLDCGGLWVTETTECAPGEG